MCVKHENACVLLVSVVLAVFILPQFFLLAVHVIRVHFLSFRAVSSLPFAIYSRRQKKLSNYLYELLMMSMYPTKIVIITSLEVKHFQLCLNIYKIILVFIVHK